MGLLDSVRAWFRRERADADEAWQDAAAQADAALARRERQLHETPEEGLGRLQEEIAAQDEAFAELRRRIGSGAISADDHGDEPTGHGAGTSPDDNDASWDPPGRSSGGA